MTYESFAAIRANKKNICEVKEFAAPVKGVYKGESDNRSTDLEVIIVGKAVNVRTGRNLVVYKIGDYGQLLTAAAHHVAVNGYRLRS